MQVGPSTNQGIWVEIYTARDLPAGIYRGKLRIQTNGRNRQIPVELELFDFTLPDRNSVHAMVYYEDHQPVLYQGRNMDSRLPPFCSPAED